MHFEDALLYVHNGGRARRTIWAKVADYTRATPPIGYERSWHIWWNDSADQIINGWGGSVGAAADGDPIRDGMLYHPSADDRSANDWELLR